MRSRDAASAAWRRTSSATCSAGAACAASESSSRLSSVEYCWSESRGPRLSVPISSPPETSGTTSDTPASRSASTAGDCSSSRSTSTTPPAVCRYASSGSLGAISTAGPTGRLGSTRGLAVDDGGLGPQAPRRLCG